MDNSIVASVIFYFKGERYAPALTIDLDELAGKAGGVDRLHHAIAIANGIDAYSYEYEMLQAEEIQFDQPSGMAVGFFLDGRFDFEGYRTHWQEQQVLAKVRPIAEQCVGVSDLDAKPKLKAALIAAYLAGKSEGK